MHKLIDEHRANIEDIYDQHYSPTLLSLELSQFSEQIFPEGSKRIKGAKPQKTIEEMFRTEKNRISPISDIVSVENLEQPYEGTCTFCRRKAVLYHQVKTFKGEWGHVCQDCGGSISQRLRRGDD